MTINVDCCHVFLPCLRDLKVNFDWNPIQSGRSSDRSRTPSDCRCLILDQFRQCAPALESLMLHYSDVELLLEHSSSPWSFVRQLHIRLESYSNFPSASLIKRLPTNKAFPQLQYLSLSGRRFSLRRAEGLATEILLCFDALVSSSSKFLTFHVNRCCVTYRSFPLTCRDVFLTLLTEGIRSRTDHYSAAQIVIDTNEEILIYL